MTRKPFIPLAALASLLLASLPAPLPADSAEPLRSGCEYDYAPFCLVREDGQADGFSVELLREALRVMGQTATFKTGAWPELKKELEEGRLDVLPMVARTPEREAEFDFTFPYLTMHGAIVVREDTADIATREDLRGKRVAVLEEDFAHEYLRRAGTGAEIVPLPSFAVALRELSEGQHDAVVIQRLLAFQLIKDLRLANLRVSSTPLADFSQSWCFAVREGDKATLDMINEGLSIIMINNTFHRLYAKWVSPFESLARIPVRITVGGDHRFFPYEFTNERGMPDGFLPDLTREIGRQMNLTVDIRLDRWSDTLDAARRGEIDVIEGLYYSPERSKEFSFSPPHLIVQHVLVTRSDSPNPLDLKGKVILVQDGDLMHDWAKEHGYGKNLIVGASMEDVLRRLAEGEGDCALAGRIQSIHWIRKNGWTNLKLGADPLVSAEYCYAVPHGKEAILAVFSEGLTAVRNTGEFRNISTRWLAPHHPPTLTFWTFLKIGLMVSIPLLLLLLLSLAWSRSLQSQVVKRTEALQKETEASGKLAAQLGRTAAELKRSNTDLEQFAYVTSHDLKEPIRMVTGFMSLLRESLAGKLDEKSQDFLALAEEGATRMHHLVDDLLAYGRVGHSQEDDAGQLESSDAVKLAVENLQGLIKEADARVTFDPLPVLKANRIELTQLFQNLINNAIKFRGQRKPVIHIASVRETGFWCFSVKDNGIGISHEYQDRIFKIFHRLHTPDQYPGTGIGLAICKKIVERHGGRIWVESKPDEGSTFYFTLPR
jgi:ABC-type amino acid transport substrate-binding protein